MCYGLPLDDEDMAIWHALHGGGVYDDLYALTGVHDSGVPYLGREYNDITLIVGRRAAKTCIGDFILCYEALLGGHKSRLQIQDQEPVFLQVAQDLGQAMKGMRGYTLAYLKSSPVGKQALGDLQKSVTQRSIRLTGPNDMVIGAIQVGPPNIKVGRGDSIPCAVLDEVAYWQSDEKSAAPDIEVEKAIEYGMSQFSPFDKRVKLSTPYVEEGLLWQMQQIGTHGRHLPPSEREGREHTLVLQGPSPVLKNPTITRVFLTQKRAKDPDAFDREIGAKFSKAVAGYLSAALVTRALGRGIKERPPRPGVTYVAAIDPALKHDAFPLCIGHLEGHGMFVQDLLQVWQGSRDQPLDPGVIIPLIGHTISRYGIHTVMSDQYHSGSLATLAEQCIPSFSIEEFVLVPKTKGKVCADFLNLLNQDKARLLDSPELEKELLGLERIMHNGRPTQIRGKRDDLAFVTFMCAHRALQFGVTATTVTPEFEPTTAEGIRAVRALEFAKMRSHRQPTVAWWNR